MSSNSSSHGTRGVVFFGRLAGIFFSLILLLVVFTGAGTPYAAKFGFTALRQPLFLVLGALVMFALCFGARVAASHVLPHIKDPGRTWSVCLAILCLALFAYQMFVVWGAWFSTDWDVGGLSLVNAPQSIASYLSRYPNQLFLYGVFRGLSALGTALGSPSTYLTLVVGGCVCIAVSVYLAAQAMRQICGIRTGAVAAIVLCVIVGASPWMLVPYSDSYGVLMPSLALWFYARYRDRPLGWFGIALASVVGYAVKPTSIFILCAALFVAGLNAVARAVARRRDAEGICRKACRARGLRFAVAVVAGAAIAYAATGAVVSHQVEVDSDLSFSMTHFLMMGINPKTKGIYSREDVKASKLCKNQEERSRMNIRVWKKRVAKLGPAGLLDLYRQKLLTAFSDGTFAWGAEGVFWRKVYGSFEPIKGYYGIGNFDHENPTAQSGIWFMTVTQVFWLGCLSGVALLLFSRRLDDPIVTMLLTVSALGLFLMVFETRARYLFLYAPYFVLLGVAGWSEVCERAGDRLASLAAKRQAG